MASGTPALLTLGVGVQIGAKVIDIIIHMLKYSALNRFQARLGKNLRLNP